MINHNSGKRLYKNVAVVSYNVLILIVWKSTKISLSDLLELSEISFVLNLCRVYITVIRKEELERNLEKNIECSTKDSAPAEPKTLF